jgi:hypothetical protein
MKYKQPMKTSQIKKVVLKAVAEYLDEQIPDSDETLGYQDEALEMANEVYDECMESGEGAAFAKKEARMRFFEEIEKLIGADLADGISGCFEKYMD